MRRFPAAALLAVALMALAATPVSADDRGICFNSNSPPDAAIEACGRLIASGKFKGENLARIHIWRAEAWSNKREHDRAIGDLDESIRLHGKIALAYYNRGSAYQAKRDYDRALADYDQAIRLDGKFANAYGSRGIVHRLKGDPDRAVADHSEAIRLKPNDPVSYNNRSVAYRDKRDYDRAIRDASDAIRLKPQDPDFYRERARSYEAKGELDKALADYRKSQALAPGNPSANDGIRRIESQLAARSSARPLDTASDDEKTCAGSGPFEAWLPACNRLIAAGRLSGGNLAMVHRHRGNWHQLKGDHDRAVVDYTEVIRLDPNNALAANSLKTSLRAVCFRSDDPAAKIAACTRFIAMVPATDSDLPAAYLNRADAHKKAGERGRAAPDVEAALRIDPNSSAALRAKAALADPPPLGGQPAAQALAAPSAIPAAATPPPPAQPPAASAAAPAPTQPQLQPPSGPTIAALTPPAAAPRPPEVRVALVVGNADYRHATRLANPANDAADVAQALRRLGFDVVEGRDLDKRSLEDKVREFSRKLDRANLALFFYAGHGMQVGGRNYLIPTDAKLERPGDLSFETIDISQVLAQMEADQRVNLVFLDACRDNPLARSFARTLGTRSASVGQGLATIQSAVGTLIAYATQPDNVALDGDGCNSPFTAALLKHLATPGLEIGSLMRRVRSDVIQATRGRQVPWDHSSLVGDVVLAP